MAEQLKEPELKDSDLMPFGKYKGTKMGDIPDWYLTGLYDDYYRGKTPSGHGAKVKEYIEYNADGLKLHVEKKK